MKIKVIEPLVYKEKNGKWKNVNPGTIFEARLLPDGFFNFNSPYQVIDGEFSGMIIEREHAMKMEEENQTEKESSTTDRLKKEREQKERAQELVKSLENQLRQKNSEIEKLEYFITSLTLSLKLSSEYVLELRKQLQK